ncbi:DASH family cryptochrome [Mucilaginibacter psychrotolerans]|uniref:Cryptochrome DASH n=1 Tax=Mucilaginibacter psychrotolerans TaxID=1524096 RepID=A0A4Y8SBZ9_9SPHI|nr:DASH family cryptochrome [Mucilaginibacter psychrotolerans]TFF36120.1 DASH family cryptochrome [Mucilaginibacter psychrotolerans]
MSVKRIALVWFKTNLRLCDNECLYKAVAENDEVIPFYCLDEQLLQTTPFGFKKAGIFRLKFLKESLQQLDNDLRVVGSGLLVLKGKSEVEIAHLAKAYSAQSIYAEKEVAPEELHLTTKVKDELLKLNCFFFDFECRNLLHTADLPFAVAALPEIFTSFRKQVESKVAIRSVLPQPLSITTPPLPDFSMPDELVLTYAEADPRAAIQFKGGAKAANQRLQRYIYETQALSTYKETRNGMIGANYSSKFSAWLALGCISAREIYAEVKAYESQFGANESTYWMIFELLWRDYFWFCMQKNGARYFLRSPVLQTRAANSMTFDTALGKWINGQTGVPFVDANMTELKLTGFMSNRGRQNVASYFCNDLKLDWRYGAAYFEHQLIDYDVCSNWGNWAYLAGVGNDPRANRYFNIDKQAAVYDADGSYRQLWKMPDGNTLAE